MGLLRGMDGRRSLPGRHQRSAAASSAGRLAKFAEKDAATAAKQQEAYDAQMGQQQQPAYEQPAPPPAAAGGISNEAIQQLKELAALKEQGILTEQEFGVQKAKILGG